VSAGESINLGAELKSLVESLSALQTNLALAREPLAGAFAALPRATARLARADEEAGATAAQIGTLMDQLGRADQEAGAMLMGLEGDPGPAEKKATLDRLKTLLDQSQACHLRIFEIMQVRQNSGSRPSEEVLGMLSNIESGLNKFRIAVKG